MITEPKEKVILIGVFETGDRSAGSMEDFMHSMDELAELSCACFMEPVTLMMQQLGHVNNALYVGPGKLEEIREQIELYEADLVIFNDTLSPSQLRNMQDGLGIAVMDRTSLILEIFQTRARTREAKLQVELARLKYLKPRLVGMRKALTRQGGTSGSMSSRGAGEKKLELDRRRIDDRIAELTRELKDVEKERMTQRKARQKSRLPLAALVGYTNAGKSTILNALVDRYQGQDEKRVFEADMLFATLDTTVRKIETGGNRDFLLSDTVGFIRKLPTGLVEAFKSTLEEVREADLLVHVVDYSDPHYREHMRTTIETIADLDAGHIPMLMVYNKADLCGSNDMDPEWDDPDGSNPETITAEYPKKLAQSQNGSGNICGSLAISAKEERSIDLLVECILEQVYGDYLTADFLIPYDKGNLTAYLMEHAKILEQEYLPEGTRLKASCHRADIGRLSEYIL